MKDIAPHTEIRVSDDGQIGSTTLPMTVPGWEVEKEQGEQLIAAAEKNSGDGLQIKLGGDPIYTAQEQASPEGLGFLGAAIVLLIAFGSVVAAGLPLVIALVGLSITSGGLILLLANVVDVPDWTTAVSGLIGIGVGIDYSLLVLTRFRTAIDAGKDRHDAVVEAVTTAGRSVIIAGATVVIAVLGLMLTGLAYMVGVALAASFAVLVVMLASITLLPSLLSYLGPERRPLAAAADRAPAQEAGETATSASRRPHAGATPSSVARGSRRSAPRCCCCCSRCRRSGMRLGLPRRRKRPAVDDDPPGLRPEHRGLRPGLERPAGRRRRAAGRRARKADVEAFAEQRPRRRPGRVRPACRSSATRAMRRS